MSNIVASTQVDALLINGQRLMQMMSDVGAIGALPSGGVRRLAFSPEDREGRQLVQRWMAATGMTVSIDAAGNMIGRYEGRFPHAPALATGSHLDTVPNAGIYDGTYGVLAGVEVARTLHDHGIRPDHPIEVIVFADEERTMIGSKAMAGKASLDANFYDHPHYEPIEMGLSFIGGDWTQLTSAQRDTDSLAAFVELHVEQGPVLEAAGNPVGLVTGIVGQRRYLITIDGSASHAGTTPMTMRQDALVAASQVVLAVNRIGTKTGDGYGEQVATVGAMKLSPNVANTIPGRVEMTLDMRDLSNQRLDAMVVELEQEMAAIATQTETQIHIKPQLRNEPVPVNSHIYNAIAQVCDTLNLPAQSLPSRASHDAQIIASITDMGMIFVPSQGGISHSETEYTTPEHCIQGANILLHTLLKLDQHYRCPEEITALRTESKV
ncbi:hydantoinase carbamoylase family [Leptolyngbya sp. Heron Island J]|uniref:Zn-dependent hydrolase n=1 Tax=Leptolyngbya sp. Heron Island J TaxID=1385935 RepID=UPI0003B9439E|nr:Zn-dependent hydrolase [Leptolyngbya sp. Heron Island J]ESA36419.1 hydantoinase carbamoylase family [Leptolyngbya sp. Heron Island J]